MRQGGALVEHEDALVPIGWLAAARSVAQEADIGSVITVRGEAGTGKDLMARMVHAASRAARPFVKVDCATRWSDRLAARLFGHERKAGPGAERRKLGALELAHRGTLFLDSLEALPAELHSQTLRFLHRCEVVRPGAGARRVDVQVILATRQPLGNGGNAPGACEREPALRVLEVQLPPLRQRPDQIVPLAEFFLARFNAWYDREVGLAPDELTWLREYTWPGNVRELATLVRQLVVSSDPGTAGRDLRSTLQPRMSSIGRQTA
jgi:DNA-binding NtrC family response regulator